MRRLLTLLPALVLTAVCGCFGPSFGSITCVESVGCPGELICIDSLCVERGTVGADASTDAMAGFSITDDDAADFAAGEFSSSQHDGIGVIPTGPSGGRFTSRVFDSGSAGARWTSFVFTPSGPYGKALPGDRGAESGYREGNIDMRDNVLLLHCEDASGGGTIDSSGRGHTVAARPGNMLALVTGRLDDGCSIDMGNYFEVAVTQAEDLSTGDSDYTWMMWARTDTNCEGNDVFMGMDAEPGSVRSHQWLGCTTAANSNCSNQLVGGAVAGTHRTDQAEPDGSFCGAQAINDNLWHHLALVKVGHPIYEHRVYMDGARIDTLTGTYVSTMDYDPGDVLTFGTFPDPGFDVSAGVVDEVAIFSRALDDADIAAAMTRAAASIRVRVRSCEQADCADASFGGADGDDQGAISDPPGQLQPPDPVALSLPPGRYFQYEVEFDRDEPGLPRFEAATATGVR